MIVNLEQFIQTERPHWERLEKVLEGMSRDGWKPLSLEEARELDRLYLRASADLARLATFSAEPETRSYLERVVATAYAEIHGAKKAGIRFRPVRWIASDLPRTFRQHLRAFWFATLLLTVGAVFGAVAITADPQSKEVLMPFPHLQEDPAVRVANEEAAEKDELAGHQATFAGELMTHNTRVALLAMALGLSWGVGTLALLIANGVGLGAVAADYVQAGQTEFLLGWLLPHGSVEIPAILIGAQAGFVLAGAMLDRRKGRPLSERLRQVVPAVFTLSAGAGLLLVWAGLVESFISQHHQPVLSYTVKIAFGLAELLVLAFYLGWAGRKRVPHE